MDYSLSLVVGGDLSHSQGYEGSEGDVGKQPSVLTTHSTPFEWMDGPLFQYIPAFGDRERRVSVAPCSDGTSTGKGIWPYQPTPEVFPESPSVVTYR